MVSAPFGFLRVAAACPKVAVADPEANAAFLLAAIREAHGRGVQVLVLPELCLPGYTAGDLFFSITPPGGSRPGARRLLAETQPPPHGLRGGPAPGRGRPPLQRGRGVPGGARAGCRPQDLPARTTRSTTRSAGFPRPGRHRRRGRLLGSEVPFGADLLFGLPDEPRGRCSGSRSARTSGRPSRPRAISPWPAPPSSCTSPPRPTWWRRPIIGASW